jgi:hypothetical protein
MLNRPDPGDAEWTYESPKITVLGSLAALTRGSTGTQAADGNNVSH